MRGAFHVATAALLLCLAACDAQTPDQSTPPLSVQTQKVSLQSYLHALTLTGAVRARIQTDLSFRISGRVIERNADVGQHVGADDVLARLDPTEQGADLRAAQAGLAGAEATMRQANATFERQKTLLASGYATQATYELADRAVRTAAGSLDVAKAQVATARDALSYTYLRAGHPGMITARNIEAGQVAQAAQTAFILAQDGPRDAVFAIYESIFSNHPDFNIDLNLVADSNITARGRLHEISPVVDEKTGTVLVKIEIEPSSPALPLGAAVAGTTHWRMDNVVILPWTALSQKNGKPAVWVVDPITQSVSLRLVTVALYEREQVVLRAGLEPGESVVIDGAKFLREGQIVDPRRAEHS
jgi:RND family efflux transporter MFP subunit